jgi:Uncharacterized membrane protein
MTIISFLGVVTIILVAVLSNLWIIRSTHSQIYDKLNIIPNNKVGLVLGTSPELSSGRTNQYFTSRMEAAAQLFHAGKVNHLILSGDNGTKIYNEPEAMQVALIELGVPVENLTLDYAGFRTLDSVVRCKKIFGQNNFTVISQKWHNHRALFIANANGLNAVAYNAPKVTNATRKATSREYLARVKALLDIYVLRKTPKFLGEKENIDLNG